MKAIVLDIEGTVCSIAFVKTVLYPFAIEKAKELLASTKFPLDSTEESNNEFVQYLTQFPAEYQNSADDILNHIKYLTKQDIKAPYLKALQGYLWKSGYESGEIKVDLFEDADEAIRRWNKSVPVYIYSSGSVPAQKLLFKYTSKGDLTRLISGYYDTQNAGPKTEQASYEKIAASIDQAPNQILFCSDNPKEIDAANAAGWQTVWTIRPGNEPVEYTAPGLKVVEFSAIN